MKQKDNIKQNKRDRVSARCLICGDVKHSLFCKKNGMEYVCCSTCNHVYVKFPFTDDELLDLYIQPTKYRTSEEKLIWDYSEMKEKYFYKPLLNKIASVIEPERLLDIGCSNGAFVYSALRCGWDAHGIELNSESVRFAEKLGLKVYNTELSKDLFPSEYFSAITLWHVIEHLFDPITLLREAVRILKPGGILAISTPNIKSIGWKLLHEDWGAITPEVHLNLFDRAGLEKLVVNCGLKTREIEAYELKPATIKNTIKKWRRKELNKKSNRVANLVASISHRRLRILLKFRLLINIPLKYFGIGEDIYGYFVK